MPMQFPDRSFGQMLLGGRNIFARWQIRNQLLADPASIQQSRLRV